MQHLVIRIGAKNDPPLFPEHAKAKGGELAGIGILESGMASGKTSVALIVKDQDGRETLVQLGAEAFLTIGAAVKGAMARFGQRWDGV